MISATIMVTAFGEGPVGETLSAARRAAAAHGAPVTVVTQEGLHPAEAINRAVARASTEVVVLLEAGPQVGEEFLPPLLAHFSDPDVFAVGCGDHGYLQGEWSQGYLRAAAGPPPLDSAWDGAIREGGQGGAEPAEAAPACGPLPVLSPVRGCTAWRRERFLRLGGFDRRLYPGWHLPDLCLRAWRRRWRTLYAAHPAVRISDWQPPAMEGGLLWAWRNVLDWPLLGRHLRWLIHRLRRPRWRRRVLRPALGCLPGAVAFRLKELAVRRYSDRAIMRLVSQAPLPAGVRGERREARDNIQYSLSSRLSSSTPPRRLLVIGVAPMPFEDLPRHRRESLRAWQFASALAADGHQVMLLAGRHPGGYPPGAPSQPLLMGEGNLSYHTLEWSAFLEGAIPARLCREFHPHGMVAVGPAAGLALAKASGPPVWADLPACSRLEGRSELGWRMEQALLARASRISVPTQAYRWATLGKLRTAGVADPGAHAPDSVCHLPMAALERPAGSEFSPVRSQVGPDQVVVLFCGSYHPGVDLESLFLGLLAAMRRDPRICFVSVGGPDSEEDRPAYQTLMARTEKSEFADRFHFRGWVPGSELGAYYRESDLGIYPQRWCYRSLLGPSARVAEMLAAGLPVICTQGSEFSRQVERMQAGRSVPPGEVQAAKRAILELADPDRRRELGQQARRYAAEKLTPQATCGPLREWAARL